MLCMQYTDSILTDIVGEKDDKEWCDEVIDALDIAASWVTH